jgi:iron donor protein CyaY
MDDQEFRRHADEALERLNNKLAAAGDRYGFEADLNSGALAIEFEDPPAKFVVSPNAPVRQIWVSAHLRSYKLNWDAARAAFVLAESGEPLEQMIAGAIGKQLGVDIRL